MSASAGSADPGGTSARSLVVFVHVPKTAGTTLQVVLRRNDPTLHHLRPNVFKGGGGAVLAPLYDRMIDQIRNTDTHFVHSHTPVGFGFSHLPSEWDIRYVTFLRNPVDRALSHYYLQLELEANGRPRREAPPITEVGVAERFQGVGYVPDNLHTRMLCGLPEPFGEATEEMLESAKENLRTRFTVFGLTERFDESIVLFARRLGYRSLLYADQRYNAQRPRGREVPDDVLAAAEAANRFDLELYRFACELFDSSPELRDPEYAVELAALRLARPGDGAARELAVPGAFTGSPEAWRRLATARADLLHRERERGDLRLALVRRGQDWARAEAMLEARPRRARDLLADAEYAERQRLEIMKGEELQYAEQMGVQQKLVLLVDVPHAAGGRLEQAIRASAAGEVLELEGFGPPTEGAGETDLGKRLARGRPVSAIVGAAPLGMASKLTRGWETQFVTVLRDPVERYLEHRAALAAEETGRTNGSSAGVWPAGAAPVLDNLQTRLLCGVPDLSAEVTPDLLQQAKENLSRRLTLVALAERMDESLVLLALRFGFWTLPVEGDSSTQTSAPQELREEAEAANRFDLELYRYAQELFDAAPERGQPEFEAALEALRTTRGAAVTSGGSPVFAPDPVARRLLVASYARRLEAEHEIVELRASLACPPEERERMRSALLLAQRPTTKRGAGFPGSAEPAEPFLALADADSAPLEDEAFLGKPARTQPPIVFVHIMMTAGGTVRSVFTARFGREGVCTSGNSHESPSMERTRAKVAAAASRFEEGVLGDPRINVVEGHTPFGLLRRAFRDDARYATFLRDPVERMISHYYFLRQHPRLAMGDVSFEEALERGVHGFVDNLATRMLCGLESPLDGLPADALELAKRNLEQEFLFVGITERLDESILMLERMLRLGFVPYTTTRVNPERPRGSAVPQELRRRAGETNRLDVELYAFAVSLFERARRNAGIRGGRRLMALRARSLTLDEWTPPPLEEAEAERPAPPGKVPPPVQDPDELALGELRRARGAFRTGHGGVAGSTGVARALALLDVAAAVRESGPALQRENGGPDGSDAAGEGGALSSPG